MEKVTQAQSNPFPFSDSNKRYHTYDYALKRIFGCKCRKIPIDAGFTCPNIDGMCGIGGCIYCSERGSGDFACQPMLPIREQYDRQRQQIQKWRTGKCIPYFQAHTNTYAPVSTLRRLFEEAISFPEAVGLNLATRADCLEPEKVALLSELAEKTVLTVELGLQTCHDETAKRIRRGHTFRQFCDGYHRLRQASEKIRIAIHIIDGLPGESAEDMRQTAAACARLHPDQIKIHLLHVLENTPLANMYRNGDYTPLSLDAYVQIVVDQLELLPPEIVIGRLTGDGAAKDLLAPDWSRRKLAVLNAIDRELYLRQSWQGRLFIPL